MSPQFLHAAVVLAGIGLLCVAAGVVVEGVLKKRSHGSITRTGMIFLFIAAFLALCGAASAAPPQIDLARSMDGMIAAERVARAACYRNGVAVGKLQQTIEDRGLEISPKNAALIATSEKDCT